MNLLGRGWSAEEILRECDHMTRADIQACLAYAGEASRSEQVY